MGIVVFGAVFVDIKGYPDNKFIPGGRNVGRVIQTHGGVSRNVAEDIANVGLRPTFVSVVDDNGTGEDVVGHLHRQHVNTDYILRRCRIHFQTSGSQPPDPDRGGTRRRTDLRRRQRCC